MTSEARSGGNALTRSYKGHGMGPLPRAGEIMWPCHLVIMDGLVTAHRFPVSRTVGKNTFLLLQVTKFMTICPSSHRKSMLGLRKFLALVFPVHVTVLGSSLPPDHCHDSPDQTCLLVSPSFLPLATPLSFLGRSVIHKAAFSLPPFSQPSHATGHVPVPHCFVFSLIIPGLRRGRDIGLPHVE